MKRPSKTTPKNLKERSEAFVQYIEDLYKSGGKKEAKFACQTFDEMLDTLHNEDFFGTEGQNDPRGDWRG